VVGGFPSATADSAGHAITTMTACMANGFTVERMIPPDLDEQICPTMLEVFIRGLVVMGEEQAQIGTATSSTRT
jgi:hypothetical protein